ncbi:MAG: hypothetical protein Q8O67_30370 [Deltaproteobacteria bacterium]|nr:hypothetical protein [Deltaproteobacteria bacterium]
METLLILGLITLTDHAGDPVQQAWKGRQESRQLECERMSQAEAHERYPADVPRTHPRATALVKIDAVVCRRRLIRYGERDARDELILSSLGQDVGELARQAAALGGPTTRWHVDAFYPQPQIVQKIATAARSTLAASGHLVSSQAPMLAAADSVILNNMSMADALPVACQRFFAEGTLGADDAWLALTLIRPQESQLHAGACINGAWRWLR